MKLSESIFNSVSIVSRQLHDTRKGSVSHSNIIVSQTVRITKEMAEQTKRQIQK